jgi:hyaluronan synthase
MAIIESHHETVHSSSLFRKRSKRYQPEARARDQGVAAPQPSVQVPPASVEQAQPKWEVALKTAMIAGAAVTLLLALFSGKVGQHYSLWPQTHFGSIYWAAAFVWGAMMYAALVWRVMLWRRYKPMKSVQDKDLPSVCVIIPAFNEGALVRQSILSVAQSNYPKDRLEIIAIDDGSSDDTWVHILTAARQVEKFVKITTLQQPTNLGKREALFLGFKRAGSDVFVSIDSDSIIHPDALRNGVAPLVREPAIGCVAGCVEVLNPRDSVFTRFLKCTFSLSFKFVRAYQSEFRGVFCTPGALSIYRASVVRKVAEEWVNQEFLGLPCTTGEDRAMTNLFLREGWLTAYQGNAVVWTKVPSDYIGMCKMLLRWGRSNIRETFFLMKFLFTDFRSKYLHAFRLNMILTIITLFLPPLLIGNSIALMATADGYLFHQLGMVLIFGLTMCTIYYINERDHDWAWLLVYEFFWVPALSWIIPYSCMTLRKTGWLTRKNVGHALHTTAHASGGLVSGFRLTAGPAVAAAITTAVNTGQ